MNPATTEEIIAIIESHDSGAFLTGGAPVEEIAAEWDGEGLTASEIEGYISARCFRAEAAVALKDAGVSPEKAAERTEAGIGSYSDTIGYKVANGDLTAAKAAAL